jgi:hypothetical protein
MSTNFRKFPDGGIGLIPRSTDPSSPTNGDIQFSDGTARTTGLWQYVSGAWVQLVAPVTPISFRAGASTTAVSSGASSVIVFTNDSTGGNFDTSSMYDNTTGVATIPANYSGKWLLTAQIRSNAALATGAINNGLNMTIQLSGSDHILVERHADASANVVGRINTAVILNLSSGNTISIKLYNNWGGTFTTINDSLYTYFSMIWLGA